MEKSVEAVQYRTCFVVLCTASSELTERKRGRFGFFDELMSWCNRLSTNKEDDIRILAVSVDHFRRCAHMVLHGSLNSYALWRTLKNA